WYSVNAAAISNITVSTAGTTPCWTLLEFSNVNTTGALDQSNTALGNSAVTPQTGPLITTTNANDVLVAAMTHGGVGVTGSVNTAAGTGTTPGTYNALTEAINSPTHVTSAYQVVSAAGTAEVDWSLSPSGQKTGMSIIALEG